MVLKGSYKQTEQARITALRKYFTLGWCLQYQISKNISLWEGVVVLKGWCVWPRYIAHVETDHGRLCGLPRTWSIGIGVVFGLSQCDRGGQIILLHQSFTFQLAA